MTAKMKTVGTLSGMEAESFDQANTSEMRIRLENHKKGAFREFERAIIQAILFYQAIAPLPSLNEEGYFVQHGCNLQMSQLGKRWEQIALIWVDDAALVDRDGAQALINRLNHVKQTGRKSFLYKQ